MFPSLIAGFTASLGLIAAIGAQNAFVLKQGLRREHVLAIVIVCAASDALLIAAGIAGLGTLVQAHPQVVTGLRWAGAAFLLGYAFLAARRALKPSALTASDEPAARLWPTLLTCLAFTYLNPHVYIDTVLLLGAIANQQQSQWLFGLGAAAASAVWFTALGLGARKLAPALSRPVTWRFIDGAIAVIMTAIAVMLVVVPVAGDRAVAAVAEDERVVGSSAKAVAQQILPVGGVVETNGGLTIGVPVAGDR